MREDACKGITICIYNNDIPFNVTNIENLNLLLNIVQDLNHHPIMRLEENI